MRREEMKRDVRNHNTRGRESRVIALVVALGATATTFGCAMWSPKPGVAAAPK